jgi:exodeoxyribonuclease VII large subunit
VVTGIGHQRDDTIADMVAHSKLKTPTAVAEFLINGMEAFDQQLDFQYTRIRDLALNQLRDQQTKLFGLLKHVDHCARIAVTNSRHQLEMLYQRIGSGARGALKANQQKLQHHREVLQKVPGKIVSNKMQQLEMQEARVRLADPVNILKRGYSITYFKGAVLKEGAVINAGDEIETHLTSMILKSNVTEIND